MKFSTHLRDHWRGQRENSCHRLPSDGIAARLGKIGLRLDISCVKRNETADFLNRRAIDGETTARIRQSSCTGSPPWPSALPPSRPLGR